MKRNLLVWRLFWSACFLVISVTGFAEGVVSNDIYNPREEIEYSYQGTMERQEARNREIQFQQYRQQEYLEQQRIQNLQDMYNQTYQKKRD